MGVYKQPSKFKQFILNPDVRFAFKVWVVYTILAGVTVFLTTFVLVSLCHAEEVPPGCYVEASKLRGTIDCFEPQTDSVFWQKLPTEDDDYAFYGSTIASLMLTTFEFRNQKDHIERKFLKAKKLCGYRCRFIK